MFSKSTRAKTMLFFLCFSIVSICEALPVKNFSQVGGTETLLRGAQPGNASAVLREHGVDAVLIFKSDTRGEVAKEISALLSTGFDESDVHHVPMAWKDLDLGEACLQTVDALVILSKAVADGKTIFFHCTAGEDRTGMLAGLYRVLHENADAEQMFDEELCEKGYSDGNPGKPKIVINQIERGLTPLYFALAEKITAAKTSGRNIGPTICRGLNPQPVDRACSSIN
jgi:hypothetical protein